MGARRQAGAGRHGHGPGPVGRLRGVRREAPLRQSSVDEVHVRDGGDLAIPGFAFAPVFSIWTTIEECLNPPIVWQDGEWRTTEPFSAPEMFPFPEGIGDGRVRQRRARGGAARPALAAPAQRVTFKYALGSDFIDKLKIDPRAGHGPHRPGRGQGRGGRAARRAGRDHARPGQAGRSDDAVGRSSGRGSSAARTARRARSTCTR